MIRVGLTRFDEHEYLTGKKKSTLFEYASYLPVVELDTSYYFIPKKSVVENWLTQVPENFQFIMKLPSALTSQGELPETMTESEFATEFLTNLAPMITARRLFCALAQFPASFKCTRENVDHLRMIRRLFPELPIAVELRDHSWYEPRFLEKTRQFMEEQQFSLAVIDEPKKLATTVPLDPYVTNQKFTLCRFHGRNDAGWMAKGPDAKSKRTLYRYSQSELEELRQTVKKVSEHSENVVVIFNNNAGGDAAENATQLTTMLGLSYQGLNPGQLDLF